MATSLVISNPKILSKDEFKAISGSELHSQMVRNRSIVTVKSGTITQRKEVGDQILEWLLETCNSIYHVVIDQSNVFPMHVYIEGDPDAVNFKMRFADMDLPPDQETIQSIAAKQAANQTSQSIQQALINHQNKKKKETEEAKAKAAYWELLTKEAEKTKHNIWSDDDTSDYEDEDSSKSFRDILNDILK